MALAVKHELISSYEKNIIKVLDYNYEKLQILNYKRTTKREMIEHDRMEIALLCIIKAIHKVASPEAMILIVKAATHEFINYLKSRNFINDTDIMENIRKIIRTLETYDIIERTEIRRFQKNIIITGSCKFRNLCKCVDKVLKRRRDLTYMFGNRPCAITMILESYIESENTDSEIIVECDKGRFSIVIELERAHDGGPAGI